MKRTNGDAFVAFDPELMARFVHGGKSSRSIILVDIREGYLHYSKALLRSHLGNPDQHLPKGAFPTPGKIARDQFRLPIPSKLIDLALARDAKTNLY